ncbi:beta-ribofuranosylaminobenzene 5'-phosphate synthase family protein [Methylibium sp.]|uniref:beta-ribofuranosylaminobenzene 5'-phosphate synthase family protein n=1 Tax=Methylibium sp. TaxID=2067992 RepID=UPI003BAB8761
MLMTARSTLRPATDSAVVVRAPGRLHLGFLDPSATLGRRFGSLGLVIDDFDTVVALRRDTRNHGEAQDGPAAQEALARASSHVATLQRAFGLADTPLHLQLLQLPPAHAGFGSGTQLALAVGRAFASLHGLTLATPEIARLLGRGLRSGVGIAGFDQGGLLLDGGTADDGVPAPLLARMELPAAWRVLLVLDPSRHGLSGADEKTAIATLPAFTQASAAAVCHEVLMRVLPGAASGDFALFAEGVSAVQRQVGAHFAPAQGGQLYASPAVARLCEWIARQRVAATGQSSWGPTGFAILPSEADAEAVVAAARAAGMVDAALQLRTVSARAHGASIEVRPSL